MQRIRKERLRLCIQRIDRDRAFAEPTIEDRSFVDIVHKVRPKVDKQDCGERPCHQHDRTEYQQMFVFYKQCHFNLTAGLTLSEIREKTSRIGEVRARLGWRAALLFGSFAEQVFL